MFNKITSLIGFYLFLLKLCTNKHSTLPEPSREVWQCQLEEEEEEEEEDISCSSLVVRSDPSIKVSSYELQTGITYQQDFLMSEKS